MDRKPYPTDLTDAERRRIKPWIPSDAPTGRPPKYGKREILDAVLYVTRNGCTCSGRCRTTCRRITIVFRWFRKLASRRHVGPDSTPSFAKRVRRRAGKTPKPTAVVLDSQTVKTTEQGGPRGKKATSRKRRVRAYTLGTLYALVVTPADVQHRDEAKLGLKAFRK